MKILILEPEDYDMHALSLYHSAGEVYTGNYNAHSEINRSIDILVCRLAYKLDEKMLTKFQSLRLIATPTTGLTHIDLSYCRKRGIDIISLRDCRERMPEITATPEHTLGLVLTMLRHIVVSHNHVLESGSFQRDKFIGSQVSDITVAIIGYGRVGKKLDEYLTFLGATTQVFDARTENMSEYRCVRGIHDAHEFLPNCDAICICASHDNGDPPIVTDGFLKAVKFGAYLINTARGEVLDELAVVKALRNGRLAGVACDVLSAENRGLDISNSPLFNACLDGYNVIITPHIGGACFGAMRKTERFIAEAVVEFLRLPKSKFDA